MKSVVDIGESINETVPASEGRYIDDPRMFDSTPTLIPPTPGSAMNPRSPWNAGLS